MQARLKLKFQKSVSVIREEISDAEDENEDSSESEQSQEADPEKEEEAQAPSELAAQEDPPVVEAFEETKE